MIEVDVHESLRLLLRAQRDPWPHQLTMARLVARGLRLGRSALMQVGETGEHRLSYLLPCLLMPGTTILCLSDAVRREVLHGEIPWLHAHVPVTTPVYHDDWRRPGLVLMNPQTWLQLRWQGSLPPGIPMVMDGAEALDEWVDQISTVSLGAADWLVLQHALPQIDIAALHQELLWRLSRRPLSQFPLLSDEGAPLLEALTSYPERLPAPWDQFTAQWQRPDTLVWASKGEAGLSVILHATPLNPAPQLAQRVWAEQPMVLIGQGMDYHPQATSFRQRLGIPHVTTLSFTHRPDRELSVWIPSPMPAPNTPQFQPALIDQVRYLVSLSWARVVILLSDQPLLHQLGVTLAAEWGSRVGMNCSLSPTTAPSSAPRIMVASWDDWLAHGGTQPAPDLVVVGTLPFPSMGDPLVNARVEYRKRQQQDWFREYLLPIAITRLQQSLASVRRRHGTLALLDSRVLTRSYGSHFLAMLHPWTRVDRPQP
ncbi:MAG: helicase C-terminal domain-containing protein [Synechococcales cyanobacterium]